MNQSHNEPFVLLFQDTPGTSSFNHFLACNLKPQTQPSFQPLSTPPALQQRMPTTQPQLPTTVATPATPSPPHSPLGDVSSMPLGTFNITPQMWEDFQKNGRESDLDDLDKMMRAASTKVCRTFISRVNFIMHLSF